MASIGKIARRTFLLGSAAIAGGVAFGYYLYQRPHENPLLADLETGEAALTPWVKIDADGVTLITPHTDLGQGAYSMQAALIAEELDIEFGQFKVSPGVPSPAYYNSALGEDLAPFMATDDSLQAEAVRAAMGALTKIMGAQGTGGSSSVPDSFIKLRLAGAVARETLKAAASQKTGVSAARLKTANGAVQLPDGTSLSYVELAPIAATIEPVSYVQLRDPSQWRLIGKEMLRLDIVPKSTGTLTYGIDLALDDMVHATVKLNPRQGGALNSYDASAAEQMRGVQKIMPVTGGVAVIADNTWRAFKAADAIEFDWGKAPYPAEMEEHWSEIGRSFTEERLDSRNRDDGNVDEALAGADVIEAEYRAPYLAHAPLEPLGAIVKVTNARADVWTATQIPGFVRSNVAELTGLDAANVHIHNQYVGGSFGHRLEDEHVKRATEVAMAMKGTPVKLTYSREEDFIHDYPRQIAMGRMRGATRNGKVDAYDLNIAMTSATRSQASRQSSLPEIPGADGQIIAGGWDQPFAIPNYRVSGYAVPGLAPTSSWRSVGASTNGFFHDGFLDELIHAAGADPLEERIRLASHEVSRKVLEAVGEMSNWGSDLGPNRGRGVAYCLSFGVPVAEVVEITNTEAGIKIDKVYVAADVGTIVDPINFDNHVKGAVVWGLGHAMNSEITYSDGMAEQNNYHAHEGMRLYQCPEIEVRGLENAEKIRGIGEPPVPPAAPALANAIFAATGQRIREMPFNKHVNFV